MTLLELITGVLRQLDRGTDAQTIEHWRDKLTRYLNDGMIDLVYEVRPRKTVDVAIENGAIDLTALPGACIKAVALSRGGRRVCFYYGADSASLRVPGVPDGTAQLTYRYLPPLLAADTDVPDLPEMCHGALILYAAGRERAMGDAPSLSAARACFELYQAARRNLRRDVGEADAFRIVNRY